MATAGGGGGGGCVAVMAGSCTVSTPSSSYGGGACSSNSKDTLIESPILIFCLFHKAISSELQSLHATAFDFVSNRRHSQPHSPLKIMSFSHRCHFLRTLYKHHCNAEDQVHSSLRQWKMLELILILYRHIWFQAYEMVNSVLFTVYLKDSFFTPNYLIIEEFYFQLFNFTHFISTLKNLWILPQIIFSLINTEIRGKIW